MTRLEKAYQLYPDGVWDDDDYVKPEDFTREYCPYNLDVCDLDYNWGNEAITSSLIKGCRGITCEECWSKEL